MTVFHDERLILLSWVALIIVGPGLFCCVSTPMLDLDIFDTTWAWQSLVVVFRDFELSRVKDQGSKLTLVTAYSAETVGDSAMK